MDKSNKMRISTISKKVDENDIHVADLDQALSVVGLGTYNIRYCLVLALFLIGAIVEPVGYAYLLPASKCDLEMSNSARGFISSVPYIGIVLMSFPWGYLVDTKGRKPVLIAASMTAGLFGIAAAFMPELISFTICKFIGSLCIACPSAAPYTFIGEILPAKIRDITLSIVNSMQIMGSALVPLYAWAILPSDFRADFGTYYFRPWRLLCIVYSLHYIIPALLLLTGPESPKYLVSQGRHDEAMAVLRTMYAANKGKSPEEFPIKALKMPDNQKEKLGFLTSLKIQTVPLVKPPYLKWLVLNGFVLFGIFNVLNGLAMWIPEVLNRVLSGTSSSGVTACEVISQGRNTTEGENGVCDDTIDTITFAVNSVAAVSCAIIALVLSTFVKFLGKKILLILILLLIGLFCIMINVTRQPMVFAVLLSATMLSAVGIGPVNAYSVEIFPTNLRGMAVGLTMMIGRLGSIVGANVAGVMINVACEALFYLFGGLLIFCGGLTLLLPKSRSMLPSKKKSEAITRL